MYLSYPFRGIGPWRRGRSFHLFDWKMERGLSLFHMNTGTVCGHDTKQVIWNLSCPNGLRVTWKLEVYRKTLVLQCLGPLREIATSGSKWTQEPQFPVSVPISKLTASRARCTGCSSGCNAESLTSKPDAVPWVSETNGWSPGFCNAKGRQCTDFLGRYEGSWKWVCI